MANALNTDVKICNAALANQGENAITTLSENSFNALKLNAVYEGLVEAALSAHGWSFATTLEAIAHSAVVSSGDWTQKWGLPAPSANLLNIEAVIDVGTTGGSWYTEEGEPNGIPMEIRNGYIYTNYDSSFTLKALCQSRVATSSWSADFAWSIVREVEGVIVGAIKKDPERGLLMRQAEHRTRERIYTRDKNQSRRSTRAEGDFVAAHRGLRPAPWSSRS